jgi:hypothetical protein
MSRLPHRWTASALVAVALAAGCIKLRPPPPRAPEKEKAPEIVTRLKDDSKAAPAAGTNVARPLDGPQQGPLSDAEPPDLQRCSVDSDCVVVRYEHCCGSVKRGINKKYLQAYNAHNNWQVFDDVAVCGLMGPCKDDQRVQKARCERAKCALIYP